MAHFLNSIRDSDIFSRMSDFWAKRFGPQQKVEFDKFLGQQMVDKNIVSSTKHSSFKLAIGLGYGYGSGTIMGLATMTNNVMTVGKKHYISFRFENAGMSHRDLYYELGVMRPLPASAAMWLQIMDDFTTRNFSLCHTRCMERLNTERLHDWCIGSIVCCIINLRGKSGLREGDDEPMTKTSDANNCWNNISLNTIRYRDTKLVSHTEDNA